MFFNGEMKNYQNMYENDAPMINFSHNEYQESKMKIVITCK